MLGIVAKHLTASDMYGTCASLNAMCHAVYDETLPTLYKKLVLWPAKAYANVPSSFWASNFHSRSLSRSKVVAKEKIHVIWERYKVCRGAAWTQ